MFLYIFCSVKQILIVRALSLISGHVQAVIGTSMMHKSNRDCESVWGVSITATCGGSDDHIASLRNARRPKSSYNLPAQPQAIWFIHPAGLKAHMKRESTTCQVDRYISPVSYVSFTMGLLAKLVN